MSDERVLIFDTTLRDGEQSPGCSMNLEEKLVIARQLEKLGVEPSCHCACAGAGTRVNAAIARETQDTRTLVMALSPRRPGIRTIGPRRTLRPIGTLGPIGTGGPSVLPGGFTPIGAPTAAAPAAPAVSPVPAVPGLAGEELTVGLGTLSVQPASTASHAPSRT